MYDPRSHGPAKDTTLIVEIVIPVVGVIALALIARWWMRRQPARPPHADLEVTFTARDLVSPVLHEMGQKLASIRTRTSSRGVGWDDTFQGDMDWPAGPWPRREEHEAKR